MTFLIPTIKSCLFPGSLNNQYFDILDTILSYSSDPYCIITKQNSKNYQSRKMKASSKDQLKAGPK